jgi:nitroreductase
MDALDLLLTRGSAKKLTDPAPSHAELETMLQAAVQAPDHGRLRPWLFLTLAGVDRIRLGDLIADYHRRAKPDASQEQLDKERAKALRAPLILVVIARPLLEKTAVPELEQILAVGAATQNIMLAAHAMGYGAMWKTGAPAYDERVKAGLGLAPSDHIVGFIYIGTREQNDSFMPRAKADNCRLELPA